MQSNLEGNVINSMKDGGTTWIDQILALDLDDNSCGEDPCGPEPVPYPPDTTTP